jgi:hypothetical protein
LKLLCCDGREQGLLVIKLPWAVFNYSPYSGNKWSSIVAEYGEDDDSDPEPEDPTDSKFADLQFVDLKLMACLLCKRQFPNKDGLDRHVQFSDLHRVSLVGSRIMYIVGKHAFRRNQNMFQSLYSKAC